MWWGAISDGVAEAVLDVEHLFWVCCNCVIWKSYSSLRSSWDSLGTGVTFNLACPKFFLAEVPNFHNVCTWKSIGKCRWRSAGASTSAIVFTILNDTQNLLNRQVIRRYLRSYRNCCQWSIKRHHLLKRWSPINLEGYRLTTQNGTIYLTQ